MLEVKFAQMARQGLATDPVDTTVVVRFYRTTVDAGAISREMLATRTLMLPLGASREEIVTAVNGLLSEVAAEFGMSADLEDCIRAT